MGTLTSPGRGFAPSLHRIHLSSLFWRTCFCILLCLLVLVLGLRSICARDPGSLFFQPATAYQRKYSLVRQEQAERYIERISTGTDIKPSSIESSQDKRLCVGIPSVGREGTRYLRTTVGSLLEGLSPEERDQVHVVVLIAHSDPFANPEYHETWLANAVDHVLLYEPDQLEHVDAMEKDVGGREKMLYDYTYALKTCIDAGTQYIAMLEDDVLASDGWFWRTSFGLQQIDETIARSSELRDYLYMRLFYTEEFLGWNSEAWLAYLCWSLVFAAGMLGTLFGIRALSTTAKKSITVPMLSVFLAITLPSLILLFFAAGRTTVMPLPRGINEMNQYGCCSQGLVFPRAKAQDIVDLFEVRKIGYVDMLIEEYADQHGELRWALTPPVLQHIGRKSSKGDDFGEASKTICRLLPSYGTSNMSSMMPKSCRDSIRS
ncbi:hypothetical protein Q7P37_005425 [Cladosporium fusiforme]